MEQILEIVLLNLPLLYLPALGVVLALVLLRVKNRYVRQGYMFRRSASSLRERHPSITAESNMPTENELDLEIALRQFRVLGLEGGDLGYAYWYHVGQLLQRAAVLQVQIDELRKALEQCRAKQRKRH